MVSRDSAIHATPKESQADAFPIDANHSDIAKFDDQTYQDYLNVASRIMILVRNADAV